MRESLLTGSLGIQDGRLTSTGEKFLQLRAAVKKERRESTTRPTDTTKTITTFHVPLFNLHLYHHHHPHVIIVVSPASS